MIAPKTAISHAHKEGYTREARCITESWPVPSCLPKPIELVIRNDVAELAAVLDILERLGSEIGLPEDVLTQLVVGLDELVSNVIKYAWRDDADGALHEIKIGIRAGAERIEVEIIDDGRAFDPGLAPSPKPPPSGRRPRPGGVGLHMVRQLVDDFHYERVDGRNRTVITKRYRPGD
jgi:anti-sigma regulatory factor (Ser/Thr protein kinase)